MNICVRIVVPETVYQKYVRAARRARRQLATLSPTTEQLMVHALTERAPVEMPARRKR